MIPRLDSDGVARYGAKPRGKAPRTFKPEDERRKAEPWRKAGYGHEYRLRREAVITAAGGRCQRCGRPVAIRTADGWRMKGGEVHHVRPLAQGGADGGLVLLCIPCHRLVDAEMRRRRDGERGRYAY